MGFAKNRTWLTCFAPEERNVPITWHLVPDGANYYLAVPSYKHAAPQEQRQVSQLGVRLNNVRQTPPDLAA